MAPNATGVRSLDHQQIVALAYAAMAFALRVSRDGATLLLKVSADCRHDHNGPGENEVI